MSTSDIKLALIGYGRIAPKHLEVFRDLGCDIIASCNRSESGRNKALNEGKIPRVYDSINKMIACEKLHGIICCASFDQVYHAAKEIIPFSLPVLLEKPPGSSLDEIDELQVLAEKYNTPIMVGLNRRYYSIFNRAILDAGGFEAITAVFIEWSESPKHFLNRGFNQEQVKKMIFGNSLHGLDLLTHFAGKINDPMIAVRNLGSGFRWLMSLQGISDRGVLVNFNSTWDCPGRWRFTFCTRGKRYIFAPLETCTVIDEMNHENQHIKPDDVDNKYKPGFYNQAKQFIELIKKSNSKQIPDLNTVRPSMVLAQLLTNALTKNG